MGTVVSVPHTLLSRRFEGDTAGPLPLPCPEASVSVVFSSRHLLNPSLPVPPLLALSVGRPGRDLQADACLCPGPRLTHPSPHLPHPLKKKSKLEAGLEVSKKRFLSLHRDSLKPAKDHFGVSPDAKLGLFVCGAPRRCRRSGLLQGCSRLSLTLHPPVEQVTC